MLLLVRYIHRDTLQYENPYGGLLTGDTLSMHDV